MGPLHLRRTLPIPLSFVKGWITLKISFKSVHIAGTNGKGSTSHMLAAILQMAGYKTGLYTSPHLKDFRERIRIKWRNDKRAACNRFVLLSIKRILKI